MPGPLEGLMYPDIYNDVSNRSKLQPRKLNPNPLLNRAINQLEFAQLPKMLKKGK